ncbi:N-6 DNA methylase [Peptoniphilaceae bacterium SGI.131]
MAVKKSELYSILWEAANKLRGGVEPSRYKDYVLLLLFFKYVSDRYKGQRYGEFEISEGASFEDLILAKGKPDVGERVDKIIQKFLETNNLKGALPDVSFNNPDELGKGKELVDKVSGLIAIFQNPAIDFKTNRASGDDIIGDAYEYFMMKFAQESGKSKGQFYTPSEVSRVIARLIGIGDIKNTPDKKWTLHDPAAGSGSLLIRAADEAPVDSNGDSIVTIYGQEKYPDTAGLAKMNFILHNKGTGEIHSDNTLAMPYYTDFGELRKFDFIVMNPPFSDKDWSDGIKADEDIYHRFDGYGIPPEKNGDYAWFLHVLKALNDNGKAGIILPHGVLFRGNAEETIRKEILKRRYIKGIVGLPSNLFYGTGIPACIIVIDKEGADQREGLFMIDASDGFKKDGDKNRLREQDIEKIVQVFTNNIEIKGYSRFITYREIIEEHDGNLNVPRYISKINKTLPQNISAHLDGGIPIGDIDSVTKLWNISNDLKEEIFIKRDSSSVYDLKVDTDKIENLIFDDEKIKEEITRETEEIFNLWKNDLEGKFKDIDKETDPKVFIRELGFSILKTYEEAKLLDNYEVYDFLLNYWNEKLQDDIYIIKASGYEAGRGIEREYGKKKVKDEQGVEIEVDDKNKFKSFDGLLIPRTIIEKEYFKDKLDEIENMNLEISELYEKMNVVFDEHSGDEGLLVEVLNDKGDSVTKTNLNNRLKELESKKVSKDVEILTRLIEVFDSKEQEQMEEIFKLAPSLTNYELRNANGKFGKGKINASLKIAQESAKIPEVYKDEYELLTSYKDLMEKKDEKNKGQKEMIKVLDKKVVEKYGDLSLEEIKDLLFNKKWMARLQADIEDAIDQEINNLASGLVDISKRYENTLSELEEEVDKSKAEVKKALERMGYSW